jgi:hypothetical protein
LNSPLEEALINFLRSGSHLFNETTGEPVANEAPIWKSSKQYVRVESKLGTSLAKNKRQESIMKALLRNYVNGKWVEAGRTALTYPADWHQPVQVPS